MWAIRETSAVRVGVQRDGTLDHEGEGVGCVETRVENEDKTSEAWRVRQNE